MVRAALRRRIAANIAKLPELPKRPQYSMCHVLAT